jgi:hypothetical protein
MIIHILGCSFKDISTYIFEQIILCHYFEDKIILNIALDIKFENRILLKSRLICKQLNKYRKKILSFLAFICFFSFQIFNYSLPLLQNNTQ